MIEVRVYDAGPTDVVVLYINTETGEVEDDDVVEGTWDKPLRAVDFKVWQ
jgi:hypothetical protein